MSGDHAPGGQVLNGSDYERPYNRYFEAFIEGSTGVTNHVNNDCSIQVIQ